MGGTVGLLTPRWKTGARILSELARNRVDRRSPRAPAAVIDRNPGTYALIMWLDREVVAAIGSLGRRRFPRGWYVYIGSALGTGGVGARIARHLIGGTPRWHLDYLRAHARIAEVWYCFDQARRESQWVTTVTDLPGCAPVIDGFGASDSMHRSHLVGFSRRPSWKAFDDALRIADRNHPLVLRFRLPAQRSPCASCR